MDNLIQKTKFILFYEIYIIFIIINLIESSIFSYETEYAKSFKLNNGNIIIAGTLGTYVYDKTGTIQLYNITMDEEDKISQIPDSHFTILS